MLSKTDRILHTSNIHIKPMHSRHDLNAALVSFKQRIDTEGMPPPLVVPSNAKHVITDDGTVSYSHTVYAFQGSACPLSNWFKSRLMIGKHSFATAEQVTFGAAKAALFADHEVFQLATADPNMHPADAKGLGRTVRNFDPDNWDAASEWISDVALLIKVLQNWQTAKELLSTRGKRICEASARDKIWGIGASAKQTDICLYPNKWKGYNRLGNSWERIREFLLRVIETKSEDLTLVFGSIIEDAKLDTFFSWFEADI